MTHRAAVLGLRSLLLDLVSERKQVDQSVLDALSQVQWCDLMQMVQQHRLGPLLNWQLLHGRATLRVPEGVRKALALEFSKRAMRNLQVQRELILTCRLLEQAGFSPVALKGAGLAWQVYPHAALRPLRDLDVLVPRTDAMRAYRVLLDAGLSRIDKYGYAGDAQTVMDLSKHLPPLRSASAALNIELHTRLFHRHENLHGAQSGHVDLSDDPGFWSRCPVVELGGQPVRVASAADLLLHLIVHAVYDHEFTNGPLVLIDLAFVLRAQRVDWSLFWSMAERMGYVRGCSLMLELAQRYWMDLPIEWHGHESGHSDAALEEVALLMLRDFDQRAEVNRRAGFLEMDSVKDKVRYIWGKIFLSRLRMASVFAVRPDDWRIYFYYPVRWAKVAMRQFGLTHQNSNEEVLSLDIDLLRRLRKRLDSEAVERQL